MGVVRSRPKSSPASVLAQEAEKLEPLKGNDDDEIRGREGTDRKIAIRNGVGEIETGEGRMPPTPTANHGGLGPSNHRRISSRM